MTNRLAEARCVVIKIGSALLVDAKNAELRHHWLNTVCEDIARLRAQGTDVVVVSSGAIALARVRLGLVGRRLRLDEKQAAASVGQIQLAQAWSAALAQQNLTAGQLLLTPGDTEDRERHLNARATLRTCSIWGACLSSTKTMPSRQLKSALAITTGWPHGSRR